MLFFNSAPKDAPPADARECSGHRPLMIPWHLALLTGPTSIPCTTARAFFRGIPVIFTSGSGVSAAGGEAVSSGSGPLSLPSAVT